MKKRNVFIASIATAIVGSGIAFAGAKSCHEGGWHHNGKFGKHKMERIVGKLDRHLDLTDQQELAVQEILESNNALFSANGRSGGEIRKKVLDLDPTAGDYDASVTALADEMAGRIKQRTIEVASVVKQVAGVLTDEQLQEARELIKNKMDKRGGWHHRVDDDEDSE